MNRKVLILLVVIVFAAFALRVFKLAENPPGLTWDEAALGYNAYSLLQTGKDEYGAVLPLTLQSFGDYKPALYAYVAIPSVALFGLNEFAVRFPSALAGTAAVLLAFFITRRLFGNDYIGLITSLVLALSPWHIQFSRGAFEANIALTLILGGFYLYLRGLEKPRLLFFSVLCFVLSLYTYQGSRLFVPLLGIALVVINRATFFPIKKQHLLAGAFGVVLLVPFFLTIITSTARQRLTVQNLFSYRRSDDQTIAIAKQDAIASESATFKLLHSQNEQWIRAIVERELNYLSPSYLFVTGDTSLRHRPPNIAHGYWVDIVFYLIGLYALAKSQGKAKQYILAWLILAPIPAVLSRDSTQALRSLPQVFAVATIIGVGLYNFATLFKKQIIRFGVIGVIAAFYIGNLVFYLDSYYVHMPQRAAEFWLTGYKPAITAIKDSYASYDKVIFTTDYNAPYIYVLFYLKADPRVFQKQAKLVATRGVDVGEVATFDNFEFRHIYWPNDRSLPRTLFVGTEEELPEKDLVTEPRARLLETLTFPNGKTAFKIVETK